MSLPAREGRGGARDRADVGRRAAGTTDDDRSRRRTVGPAAREATAGRVAPRGKSLARQRRVHGDDRGPALRGVSRGWGGERRSRPAGGRWGQGAGAPGSSPHPSRHSRRTRPTFRGMGGRAGGVEGRRAEATLPPPPVRGGGGGAFPPTRSFPQPPSPSRRCGRGWSPI